MLKNIDASLCEILGSTNDISEQIRDAAFELNGAIAGFAVAEGVLGNITYMNVFTKFHEKLKSHKIPPEIA